MAAATAFTPAQAKNLRTAFAAYSGISGFVPKALLGTLIRSVGVNALPWEIQDMEADVGDEFDIDTFFYLVYCASRGTDPEVELQNAVRLFDADGTGKVSAAVVRRILTSLKDPYTPAQIDEVLDQAEWDDDGFADTKAFVRVLLNL
jgi:Ca2+-binding EF-hand superfamily protein